MGFTTTLMNTGSSVFTSSVVPPSFRWSFTNATSSIDLNEYKTAGYGSIFVEAVSSSTYTCTYNKAFTTGWTTTSLTTDGVRGSKIDFFCFIKTSETISISAQVNLHQITSGSSEVNLISGDISSTDILSGDWTLIRATSGLVPEDTNTYSIEVILSVTATTTNSDIYIHRPVIYNRYAFLENNAMVETLDAVPRVFHEDDSQYNDSLLSHPFYRLMDILTASMDDILSLITTIQYNDISDGYDVTIPETKSILIDADVVARGYTDWLAQFVGVRLQNPSGIATPWENLPGTWDGIDLIDSVDSAGDSVQWKLLEAYNPEPSNLLEFLRWQIKYAYTGINAGSRNSVINAAKWMCTGTKQVNLTCDVATTPFVLAVTTKLSEFSIPDTDYVVGDDSQEIIDILNEVKPLGYTITHSFIS
jgi:hypothetical protein